MEQIQCSTGSSVRQLDSRSRPISQPRLIAAPRNHIDLCCLWTGSSAVDDDGINEQTGTTSQSRGRSSPLSLSIHNLKSFPLPVHCPRFA